MNASLVHIDKIAEWGASLGDDALGRAIYDNPKLRSRAADRMADVFGISDYVDPPNAAPKSNSLMSMSGAARSQGLIINIFTQQQNRFITIAGLVRIGGILKSSVTPTLYQAMLKSTGIEDMKLAARIARALDVNERIQMDMSRIEDHIRMLGEETIAAWRLGLTGKDRAKLDFSLGAMPIPDHLSIDSQDATEIMVLISAELHTYDAMVGG